MANNNKSYRIRTNVGREADTFLDVHLDQDYDSLEILSLKISDKDVYKLHNSDYGVIVGRVLANGNFGVPNAKISVFIETDEQNEDLKMWNLYPYTSTSTKNEKDIRYNLLPDESVKDCHKAVGTFPHKTYLLENDALLEVFDKYYVYTTRTNAAGDYLICGVPTGMQTLHMDLDLSDCGILSQRPRDFVYKGYTIEQFENPNQFKKDENLDGLSQIFSQNQPVYVQPFWGNEDNGEEIGITRADIEISFKFEPTCVFMGSAISDNASNGVGKKCVPTNQMGAMDELTAGEGTIEMIRKTPAGNIEEFPIKGNQLINGNGVWCYQIPMNLDYMMTDEYGHMVPTDDPAKGIPTRTRVRFRASLTDMENSSQSYYRAKYLIPNNPSVNDGEGKIDYDFGTYTDEDSFRDLFWNGVYTVKSYIPRFQKSKRWKNERFSGIKACNYYGGNNPMPYNNLRIKLPFMFTVLCIFVKLFIKIVSLINRIIAGVIRVILGLLNFLLSPFRLVGKALKAIPGVKWLGRLILNGLDAITGNVIKKGIKAFGIHCTFIGDGLCPDMEGWYFAPGCAGGITNKTVVDILMNNTLAAAIGNGDSAEGLDDDAKDAISSGDFVDETSTDVQNTSSSEEETACLTVDVDYLLNCFEMNLAQEYRVIKFDFYNDWVNGVLYFPRWMRKVKRKKKYKFSLKNGITTYYKDKVKGCMNSETSTVKKSRYYTQQCSLSVAPKPNSPWTAITTSISCYETPKNGSKKRKDRSLGIFPSRCHKKKGMTQSPIFGKKSGLVTERTTMLGQYVYYLKPCEWQNTTNGYQRTLLFATDLVLLGTLNDCDENGIPQAFKYLNNSSYIMPTNLALTTMDDDAYIYTAKDGTVCSSKKATSAKNKGAKPEDNVLRMNPGYESTYSAYSQTDYDTVEYGENDDPIPVTESAGITWNYSGPGQEDVMGDKPESPSSLLKRLFKSGNKRYEYLYYPGGHFLGLSCVNSETNIKSCVNLKRICELGATMSQRREELRGYDEETGNAKFRYYVPTGLISNVDIEGAAFRSMFATLNHNKLVANEQNEQTGYKKYTFRFLRPDGFDGSLGNYVHRKNSPYNSVVGDGSVQDATSFFDRVFNGIWSPPADYDKYEVKYTERRTVEDSINDYYMFRFGLDTFADKEQKKHYLGYVGGNYSMPQYENSFYFYFGLKDGATALDEFKKQFFSECASNNIMKSPQIYVKEEIHEDLTSEAYLVIDNMLPTFTVVLKDETTGQETNPFYTESEYFKLSGYEDKGGTEIEIKIGHKYTVIVTDSIDQTAEITFVFGSSSVKVDAATMHFRVKSPGKPTINPRKGGYVKINDKVIILKNQFSITSGQVTFEIHKVVNGVEDPTELSRGTGPGMYNLSSYVDATDETWFLYYLPEKGTYNFYVKYQGKVVSVYTATMDDNSKVNLFVSCDYLAYKPERDFSAAGNTYRPCWSPLGPDTNGSDSAGLRNISDSEWHNGSPFKTSHEWQQWLMRHTFYRQTADDTLGYNNLIYSKGNTEIAIFGEPEKGTLVQGSGIVNPTSTAGTFYRNDAIQFPGDEYYLDHSYSFYPSMYWNGAAEDPRVTNETNGGRNLFDAMSYTDDGRAAADALDDYAVTYNYDTATTKVTLTGSFGSLSDGHGCIVVFENGVKLFAVKNGSSLVGYYYYDFYPNDENNRPTWNEALLKMATIYPTLHIPTIYKPLYGIVSAATWNLYNLQMTQDDNGNTVPEKVLLPGSYKMQGNIFNGLTYKGAESQFYSGNTVATEIDDQTYDTYIIFNKEKKFWETLKTNFANDVNPQRAFNFGKNMWDGFGREITEVDEENEDFSDIIYAVKEAIPYDVPENATGTVYTERYDSGMYDQITLTDTCNISDEFIGNLKIKVYDENQGITGQCSLYTDESLPKNTKYYITRRSLFNETEDPIMIYDSGIKYYYGTYNENAKYNIKGSVAIVKKGPGPVNLYKYSVKQENGTEINKKIINELPSQLFNSSLYEEGITLLHGYTLKNDYKKNVENITNEINSHSELIYDPSPTGVTPSHISVPGKTATPFNGNDIQTVIAVYVKPEDGTKNKMVVYKLYPYKALDVMFPVQQTGVEPYLNPPPTAKYSKSEQDITMDVSSNVSYSCRTDSDGWLTINPTVYTSTATSITFRISENPNSASSRTARIYFYCTDVGVTDPDGNPLTGVTEVTQEANDVIAAQNAADAASAAAQQAKEEAERANERIDDLPDPDSGGGE